MGFIDFLNQYSNIIQIVIGILSLLATILVSFLIYWLQYHHEKEIENIQTQQRKNELKNQADQFLIDNTNEIQYLPLCVIASSLHRHDKHCRKIYTNFCRCSDELQEEVLTAANFSFHIISDDEWVDTGFSELCEDITKHKLGQNVLYDGAKYFHRGFTRYKDKKWEIIGIKKLFEPIAADLSTESFFRRKMDSFGDYVEEYFHFLYSDYRPKIYNHAPVPPIDYLCQVVNFSNEEDESIVCAWIIHMVNIISIIIHNIEYTKKKTSEPEIDYTDAEIETYEDAYYDALRALYNTYYSSAK